MVDVTPFQCDAEVRTAGPVSGGFILCVQGCKKVFGVFDTDVFHAKFIDTKG